jgi:hypothetical protein
VPTITRIDLTSAGVGTSCGTGATPMSVGRVSEILQERGALSDVDPCYRPAP